MHPKCWLRLVLEPPGSTAVEYLKLSSYLVTKISSNFKSFTFKHLKLSKLTRNFLKIPPSEYSKLSNQSTRTHPKEKRFPNSALEKKCINSDDKISRQKFIDYRNPDLIASLHLTSVNNHCFWIWNWGQSNISWNFTNLDENLSFDNRT